MSSYETCITSLKGCLAELSDQKRAGQEPATHVTALYGKLNAVLEESVKASGSEMVATANLAALEQVILMFSFLVGYDMP